MSINVPWSQKFSDVQSFWELSLLLLGFGSSLTVASRLLPPYITEDKTPRLMVKQLSAVRNTQRNSQSYIEKRKGRKEIEVTRSRKERVKKGENNQARNQTPKCFPQPGTHREIHRVIQRKEEGERR